MRCRECDYPLWNLSTRICPECGQSFAPSAYRFLPNSVRYCCPHCAQEYYGTDASGHLVPREFDCVTCGQRIAMDEMVLRPAAGVRDDQTEVDTLPWLHRQGGNWLKCWWQTVWNGMIAPNRLMNGIHSEARVGEAWWFAAISFLAFLLVGGTLPLLALAAIDMASGGGDALMMFGWAIGLPIGGTLVNLLFIAIWAASTHGILAVTGGAERSMGHTVNALCYTVGPNVLMAIPCIGMYCAGYAASIWWVVCAVLAVAAIQKVGGGRAALATLALPIAFIVLVVGGYFGLIMYGISSAAMTSAGGTTTQMTLTPNDQTGPLNAALLKSAKANGQWPVTALELVRDDYAMDHDFITSESDTRLDQIPVGPMRDLGNVNNARPQQRALAFDAAADRLGPKVIAHRVGDFVFTYHGIEPATGDPNLWTTVQVEDPDAVIATTFDTVYVGTRGGNTISFRRSQLPQRVIEQNALRAEHGLPPLPITLDQITHANPATEQP